MSQPELRKLQLRGPSEASDRICAFHNFHQQPAVGREERFAGQSSLIAMGAMSTLEASGVRIPEDVSIVGIDDIAFAFLARPPLTTIGVPRERLGTTAFEALIKMLELKRHKGSEYKLKTELVVRKSTAPARHNSLNPAR